MVIIHLTSPLRLSIEKLMRISHYSTIVVETHEYCLYLKPMVNIILKKYWKSLFKSPKENIIYKIIHDKNYEKPFKLLFTAHEN